MGVAAGRPAGTSGTAAPPEPNWSVVVINPPPRLEHAPMRVDSGSLESRHPSRGARSGLGMTAAMAVALALIAIVLAPRLFERVTHGASRT
jgi:hypothetical protein